MVNVEYANAYKEVIEILKFISEEEYEKVPKDLIELFESNSNKEYSFLYNPNKTLDEQKVSKKAKAIISLLYRDYWANDEEKEKLIKKQKKDRILIEEQKRLMYDAKDMFKKRNNYIEEKSEDVKAVVEYKENIIIKLINKIKSFFEI